MSFDFDAYIPGFREALPFLDGIATPWDVTSRLGDLLYARIDRLDRAQYRFDEAGICIHRRALIEAGAVIKPPTLIEEGAFVAAHAYLRGGTLICAGVRIGPGCEVKASLIMAGSTLAHFNFVGDSLIGRDVNLEAGAVIANHFNERPDKIIAVADRGRVISTGTTRFGAVVGDGSAIGANAVLSPGSLLPPRTVVGRLQLVLPVGT
ncbi:LbetaH domain-containing protein [Shumkonia mesophila]|uniref:hypothetical protein n=1 Tax=Shumkonia mesophila TaxID=2838854 RepID=UPI0029349AEB|nr:hypothetical protein [Shumkonia mesophila]